MSINPDDIFHRNLGEWIASAAGFDSDAPTPTNQEISQICDSWETCMLEHIQSPIEGAMLAEFLFTDNKHNRDDDHIKIGCADGGEDLLDYYAEQIQPFSIYFATQEQIGRYRVDFLFICFMADKSKKYLVVECDGHDFHEKTKEQARRDKARDRFFVSNGYAVLRFTGSEIYHNSRGCAKEVSDLLDGWMKKEREAA